LTLWGTLKERQKRRSGKVQPRETGLDWLLCMDVKLLYEVHFFFPVEAVQNIILSYKKRQVAFLKANLMYLMLP